MDLVTFPVYFSNPAVRFLSQPQPHWKLSGAGTISFEENRVVLHGRRQRSFWFPKAVDTAIARPDISNVIREQTVVQMHVRVAGKTQVLRLWLKDEATAQQIVAALPRERTADFERILAEHSSFNTALAALGTQSRVVPALLVANIAIFALTVYAGGGLFQPNVAVLVNWGTNFGPRTLHGEWWRLLTSTFLHFGLLHVALNMWALWGVGRVTERLYGSGYFLVLYLFAGLFGSFASLYWHPNINSAGASGAIFGVIGGLLAFVVNPRTRIPPSVASAHGKSAGVFILYNLLNGAANAGIDNAAHIGGLIGGFVIGFVLARPLEPEMRRDPLPRLGFATLIGVAALIALLWPYR